MTEIKRKPEIFHLDLISLFSLRSPGTISVLNSDMKYFHYSFLICSLYLSLNDGYRFQACLTKNLSEAHSLETHFRPKNLR